MTTNETKVTISLDRESVEHLYVQLRARTGARYAPKAEMVLDDFRKALRESEEGVAVLQKYEDF